MNILSLITAHTPELKDLGLLFLRVGLGIVFIVHGGRKILAGTEEWLWLGSAMENLGITFAPLFWGILAALSESLGGVFLMLGLGTRIAAFFMACVMFVAMIMHISKNDTWGYISHPLALLIVFISIMIMGGGSYSLDAYIIR